MSPSRPSAPRFQGVVPNPKLPSPVLIWGSNVDNLGKQEVFYEALERALHNYLRAKLDIVTSEFSKEKITILLAERKVKELVVLDFIALLKSCEFARYTPTSDVMMKQDYEKAIEVISNIDKQIFRCNCIFDIKLNRNIFVSLPGSIL